jgi:prepilin-type N-terminal cleavage/methylation domain-containing protein
MKIKLKIRKGLSLLELMLTMSLACILLGIGYRGFSDMITTQSLKSGMEQSALAIKQARYHATSKGVITRINFPVSSSTYSITADNVAITNSSNFSAMSGVLPDKVKISYNSCGNLGFYVDGTPISYTNQPITSNCMIKLNYNGGEEKSITIQAGTGNIVND